MNSNMPTQKRDYSRKELGDWTDQHAKYAQYEDEITTDRGHYNRMNLNESKNYQIFLGDKDITRESPQKFVSMNDINTNLSSLN